MKRTLLLSLLLIFMMCFSSIMFAQVTVELGTGTDVNGTSGAPAPYGTWYKAFRQQFLVLASELNNEGAGAGDISSLAFNVSALNNSIPMNNFRIRLKHTNQTALTTSFEAGTYTQVFQSNDFVPTVGWNTHVFDTPFVWDGASNILIDIITDVITGSYAQNASAYFSTTTFNSSLRFQSDTANGDTGTTGTAALNRSNMKLGMSALDLLDMAAVSIVGPTTPSVNSASTYTVRVRNLSPDPVSNYSVKLLSDTDELFSLPGVALDSMEFEDFEFEWTPTVTGLYTLYGKVVMPGDENPLNDVTQPLEVIVMEEGLLVAQVGDGILLNTETGVPTPYGTYYKNFRQQFLVTANELYAGGATPGSITAMAFNVSSVGTCGPMPNYRIRLKHTAQTALTTTFETGDYQQVFHDPQFMPTADWNMHAFQVPFYWDGTSNLLVEIVTDLAPAVGRNALVYYSATGFNSSVRYQSDSIQADGYATGTVSVNRSNMRFYISTEDTDDMAALGISGPIFANVDSVANFNVRVMNICPDPVSNYTVKLMEVDGGVLASVPGVLIDHLETAEITIPWTPTQVGTIQIYGRVEMPGDENALNDDTFPMTVNVIEADKSAFVVGDGTSSNAYTAAPAPYGTYYQSFRQQLLVKADEIYASGGAPGLLSGMAFDVSALNGCAAMTNYRIRLKSTDLVELSTTFELGDYTQVFQTASFMPGLGWNIHEFDAPFFWDGVSNLIVEIITDLCGVTGQNASVRYSTPGFYSSLRAQSNTANSEATATGTRSLNRSNICFFLSESSIVDMAAISITGPYTPNVNSTIDYTIRVMSSTSGTVTDYTVKLMDGNDNVLASVAGPPIDYLDTADIVLSWMPTATGEYQLYGRVEMPGDEFDTNDNTAPITVHVMEEGIFVAQIGGGVAVNTETGVPNVYGTYYKNFRQQFLVKADELYDAGAAPGFINAIAFEVANLNACTPSLGYRIRIKETNLESFTTTFELGDYTQVFQATNFMPVNGWNLHPFSELFFWDGTSNIIVEIVTDLAAAVGRNASSPYTATSFNSSLRYQSDSVTADGYATGTVAVNRTNMRLFMPELGGDPELAVNPAAINFGDVFFGATVGPRDITVSNIGGGSITLTTANVSLSGSTQFSFDNSVFPITLESAESEVIPVSFTGTVEGAATALITITFGGEEFEVELSANTLPDGLIIIGDGIANNYMPVNTFYGYSYAQMLYRADEIQTTDRQIEKIAYHWNGAGAAPNTNDWTIYMGHTDKEAFASTTDWIALDDLVQVYQGTIEITAVNQWIEIVLPMPFIYNGADNLVIAVRETKPSYDSSSYFFYTTASTTGRSIRCQSDSIVPDPAAPPVGTLTSAYPNIRMYFGDIPVNPVLSVNPAGDHEFPLTMINTTAQKEFTVANTGGGNINVTNITITGDGFALAAAFSPVMIGSGEMYSFTIKYSPTAAGDHNATLLIESDAGDHSAELTGSCFDPTIDVFPHEQGFNVTAGTLPENWTATEGAPGASYHWRAATSANNGPSAPFEGTAFAHLYCYLSSITYNPYYLNSPPINLDSTPKRLKYWYWIGANTYAEPLFVEISTDGGSNWLELVAHNNSQSNQWIQNIISLEPYADSVVFLRFKGMSNYGSGMTDLGLDLFEIEDIPSNPVFVLSSDNHDFGEVIINTSASHTFTITNEGGGNLSITDITIDGNPAFSLSNLPTFPYGIGAMQELSFDAVFAPIEVSDEILATITIIDDQNNRYRMVAGSLRTERSNGSQTRDDHTIVLTGSCFDPTVTVLPYTENFDSVTAPAMPVGWTVLNPDNTGVFWKTYGSGSHSSPNCMYINYTPNGSGPLNDWFITPPVALEAGKEYRVSFYYRAYNSSCHENLALYFGSNPTATGMTELLWSDEDFNRTSYALVEETVSPTADGSYFFGWYAYSGANEYGIYVDSIKIEELSPTPVFAVEPSSYDFGEIQINTTSNKSIKVSNIGGGLLGITAIEISGDDAFELGTLPTLPASLGRDEFIIFDAIFAPIAVGDYSASITITDDQNNRYSINAGSLRSKNTRSRDAHTVALTGSCFDPTIRTFPFFEGFEDGYTNAEIVAGRWIQITGPDIITGKQWTANNLTDRNREPKTGDMNAFLAWNGQSTLIRPIMLEANKEYKLQFYARQDGAVADNAKIKASFGTSNTLEGLTETIIAQTGVIDGDYQEFSGVFSTETSGLYYIGINGWINTTPWYLSLDDISIDYNYVATPNTPADIDANTTVTIAGAGFVGAIEVPVAPENLTPIPNTNFIVSEHQVWELIGTGTVTLTFNNNDIEEIWIAYIVSGAWVSQIIPAGGSVDIDIELGAKDAGFEFALGKGGNPTLPVELSYFNAVFMINENSVKLSWKTESETQMLGYQIYRSTNKELANAIMITPTIINASNNSTGDSYSYLDREVENGTYYYWLEAVSYNSSEYYGYQTVVIDIPSTPELPEISSMSNAYPNPFKDMTNVDIAIKGGETGSFTIYNMLGQVVYKQKLSEGNVKIEWHGRDNHGNRCGSGVYFYKLVTPTKSETKKMVIMK